MKIKKDKTIAKEVLKENDKNHKKKKDKSEKTKVDNPQTKDATSAMLAPEKQLKTVDTTIFQHFNNLTSDMEQMRMDAALQLVQQLNKTKEPEKRKKELAYSLKRLIRGCGASTNASRAGFFTGLVAFLKAFVEAEINMEQIFETIQKELHVGATIANKEDADAVVGKILTCGALLHAGRIAGASSEHLEQITNILLQATKHRTYHSSLGFSFVIELLETLTESQFEASVWPLLHIELTKPWPKQTLQTVHCLIAAQHKFPTIINAKFMKTHFGGTELLNPESYQYLHKIFWEHSNTNILTHPAFELFGLHIANNAKLSEFWKETVDPSLQTPTKLLEIETIKIAADILNNLSTEKTNIVDLLSPNFMSMLVEGLKKLKEKKDETLKAFYNEFFEALVNCCSKKVTNDEQKVEVIRRLILPPGAFNIEKYTKTRIVHQLVNYLGEQGVKTIFQLYKSIFLATLAKNSENSAENWLNFERQNAGYMLQHLLAHKSVAQAYNWRKEQLQFFLTCGIFYVSDATMEICKKEECSEGAFSKDFGDQCKNMFFSSLQSKLTDLQAETKLLLDLVHVCNEQLQRKHAAKYFRIKQLDDQLQKTWKVMYEFVTQHSDESTKNSKKKKNNSKEDVDSKSDKLQLVFHFLILNMGLQLFREPEMAIPAIEDLLKCIERTKKQPKKSKKLNSKETTKENTEEPEWIEVVVDLFLHLLSQNATALRNIVNALFPHLCGNLNLSSVHQILAMLDMKNGQNPLSAKGDEDEEDDDDDDNDEKEGANNESAESEISEAEDNEDEEDDDEEDDDEEDDDEEDDDEEDDDEEAITDSDKLRNAISQALIETGGAADGRDDDMDSIDLNDMTEEEGNKLDEALANAFRGLKKSGSAAQSKKSKSYRVQTTTVMHFRIRVLDLIEIYLQQHPTLLISIEIMLALYEMLQFCVGNELKPLQSKVEKVLTKLTSIKSYASDSDLNENNLIDFIRLVVEKKAPVTAFDLTNKLRNKCIVFLIENSKQIAESTNSEATKVLNLCQEYTEDFVKSRNPIVNITLLSDIFKMRWSGVWALSLTLAEKGISMQTRTFRRIQIYEILSVLYKNHGLLKNNDKTTKKELKKIEKSISKHITQLCTAESIKLSAKEFQTLLELLLNAHRVDTQLQMESSLASQATCNMLQELRRKIKLDSLQLYQRFCAAFKLQVIRNNEVTVSISQQNGDAKHMEVDSDDFSGDDSSTKKKQNGHHVVQQAEHGVGENADIQGHKRKKPANDLRKEKKLKKQQRMQAASKGLKSGFSFEQPATSGQEDN